MFLLKFYKLNKEYKEFYDTYELAIQRQNEMFIINKSYAKSLSYTPYTKISIHQLVPAQESFFQEALLEEHF